MMLALAVLELMVGMPLADYLSARASEQEMQEWALQDGTEWTITCTLFANLGGFVMRFPSSNLLTLAIIQLKMDQDLSEPTIAPSKEVASDQSIKHAGVTGQMSRNLALQTLPSKLKAKKHACPLNPAHCPYRNEGICVTYEYILSSTIKPTNNHPAIGRFRINPNFTFSETQRISTQSVAPSQSPHL